MPPTTANPPGGCPRKRGRGHPRQPTKRSRPVKFEFTPATKHLARARVALIGPPGSGKTYTGLKLATAFADGTRPAVIDTERGSASKYADEFGFDTLNLTDFHPQALINALGVAAQNGYTSILIDSLSHFWSGANGMLEQ
ncbi:hypothetical protein EMG21_28530, partial [Klebsiella pneumoniae]